MGYLCQRFLIDLDEAGSISIPRDCLDKAGLSCGGDVLMYVEGGALVIMRATGSVPGVSEAKG
jgi:hypothetical protein